MAGPIIGKVRDGDGLFGPRWRVTINGAPSVFTIEKSIAPKYRQPQMWDVCEGDDPHNVLFDSSSLEMALGVFRAIALATGSDQ